MKELSKYSEELHTKHRSVKETESTTEECVRNMKATLIAVHRAKDNYKQRILGEQSVEEVGSVQLIVDTIILYYNIPSELRSGRSH